MFKNKLVIEIKADSSKKYRFECDSDAALGEAHDAICAIKAAVVRQIVAHQEKESQKKECKDECKTESAPKPVESCVEVEQPLIPQP